MTRYIRVDYSVRTEVNLDELKTAIGEFVAGIRHTRGDPVGSRGFDGCSAGGAVR